MAVTNSRRGRGPVGYRSAPTARRKDSGSATAEFAVAMPAVIVLLLVGLTAISAVMTKMECADAARQAARAEARGEDGSAAGTKVAPRTATVLVGQRGDTVSATVRAPIRPLATVLPGMTVSVTAVAETEPGVGR